MIQHVDGRSETKTTFKTRYWWYAGTFISHARTHSNLHIVRLMLKMNCSKRPKRSKKTLSRKDTCGMLVHLIPHRREPADWNIALQVVQLSIQAVERNLDKTALLVLTEEELIAWLVS